MNDFHLCQHCTHVVGRMGKKTPRNQLLYRPRVSAELERTSSRSTATGPPGPIRSFQPHKIE
jgi:hypothetical protein